MTVVSRIVEGNGKICPALFAMEEGNRPACEIASRDFKCAALAGHQRQYVGVGFFLFGLVRDQNCCRVLSGILAMLQSSAAMGQFGDRGGGRENHRNGEDLLAEAHRHPWSLTRNIEHAPCSINRITRLPEIFGFVPGLVTDFFETRRRRERALVSVPDPASSGRRH
jgi:hypothetical protein